jgi:hypothetical protein
MNTNVDLGLQPNIKAACAVFYIPRATYYRKTANGGGQTCRPFVVTTTGTQYGEGMR